MPEAIAMLTNKTHLMHKNGDGKWETLVPITKYPQLGGEPEQVEVTRLCDSRKRYINGLEDAQGLTFEANYVPADYKKLSALATAGTLETYRLCFGGETGSDGCFEWSGKISVYIAEGESNAPRKMSFTISDEGEKELSEVEPLASDELAD